MSANEKPSTELRIARTTHGWQLRDGALVHSSESPLTIAGLVLEWLARTQEEAADGSYAATEGS